MTDRRLLIRILGTTALTTLGHWLIDAPALANPQGATIVGGGAIVVQTSPSRVDINQSTNNAVINWQSFSVGSGELTNFNQPSSSSLTVNRVTGIDPSTIAGQITANGRIVLTNPNGVLVSQGARVNVGSFVATTSGITDANAMAGNLAFTVPSSSPTASVVNRGRITVKQGGLAALVAPGVENDGIIRARLGKVALASGQTFTLDFNGDRLVNFAVNGQVLSKVTAPDGTPLSAAVVNSGKVSANGGVVEISVDAAKGVVDQSINMTGIVEAKSVRQVAGTIVLDGGANGVVNLGGTLAATGSNPGESGGTIRVRGNAIMQTGTIDASGAAQGGTVKIAAAEIINQGRIAADGRSGDGGAIAIRAASTYIDTEYATLSARSLGAGNGGSIGVTAGAAGSLFASGTHSVRSAQGVGGSIAETAGTIDLVGAALDASGATGGGSILIGGGLHGQGTLAQATTTLVTPGTTLDADARTSGNGGTAVIWSDSATIFAGAITARGGAQAGNGGTIEVSSKGDLTYAGTTDLGAAAGSVGTLLLDPANITIETGGGVAQYQLIDPAPTAAGGSFGASIVTLSNGNIVVTDPTAALGATTNVGAVYLFNGTTAVRLASVLTGSAAGDQVGSGGIFAVGTASAPTSNFVVASVTWGSGGTAGTGLGAVTWGSGVSGVSGIVSGLNSLVGSTAGDQVGGGVPDTNVAFGFDHLGNPQNGGVTPGITLLGNGNYVVDSPHWTNSGAANAGAVTFGSGASGVAGSITAANSLVGSQANDAVGTGFSITDDAPTAGVVVLGNGNYVVASPYWANGGALQAGAVTWGSGVSGVSGAVSPAQSLVGSTAGDEVGGGNNGGSIFLVGPNNANYVVASQDWNDDAGAATFGSGATGISGPVSASNSLVGTTPFSFVSGGGVVTLTNGNYVVLSPSWGNGTVVEAGAATWGSGATGVIGPVSATNSLVGSTSGDQVGGGNDGVNPVVPGAVALRNGNYVVISPLWSNVTAASAGAATWGSGASGVSGAVTAANSLVGSTAGDNVGSGGVVTLNNGNYVVLSPNWSNNGTANMSLGAATWGSGTVGVSGAVSAANSLVGQFLGDQVGSSGVTVLSNNNFVVLSPQWGSNGTAGLGIGAATWGNGASGTIGTVTATNSLVGSVQGDQVSSNGVVALNNGNYVVLSPNWSNGFTAANAGAATWGNGASGVTGAVTSANSLVGGLTGDEIGSSGVTVLSNGNYVVVSPNWNSAGVAGAGFGAVTWGNGATGTIGTVSAANSLVGAFAGDQIGNGGISVLNNGNYVVLSPQYGTDGFVSGFGGPVGLGAATWGNGATGTIGTVSAANSLVGSAQGDQISGGGGGVTALGSGNYVVLSPQWGSNGTAGLGIGAATWGSGASGVSGTVSATNSLVGSVQGDQVGSGGVQDFSGVNVTANSQPALLQSQFYLVLSPSWNGSAGAITLGSSNTGISGAVTSDNSLVGSAASAGLAFRYYDSTNTAIVAAENQATGGQVVMGLFDPNLLSFARAQDQSLTLSPTSLAAALAVENVTLQASDDITFANNFSVLTGGHNLTLQAGGTITLDAGVTVALDGSFTAIANDPGAVAADRMADAATSAITMGTGSTIDTSAGTGGISLMIDSVGSAGSPGPGTLSVANLTTTAGAITINDTATGANGAGVVTVNALTTTTGSVTITAGTSFTATGTIDPLNPGGNGAVTINSGGPATVQAVMGTTVLVTSASGALTVDGQITASAAGDAIVLVAGGTFVNNVGATALDPTGGGRWLVYSQNPANDTDNGLPADFKQYNATYPTTPVAQATGNGLLYTLAPIINLTGVTKIYDGTTTATLVNTGGAPGNYTETAGVDGDTVTLSATSGNYATPDAGTGIAVAFAGLAVTATNPNVPAVYGYQAAVATPNTVGTITREPVTITAGANTKTYDGTTSSATAPTVTTGTLYDPATLTENYPSPNVGTGLTLTPTAVIGGNGAANYIITLVNSTAGVINAEPVTITAQPNTKTYDSTTSSATAPAVTTGTLYDPATLSQTYASPNAGTGLTLTPTAVIGGNGAGNYIVTLVNSTAGVINVEPVTITAQANTKTYDGTTAAAAVPLLTTGTLFARDQATLGEAYQSANAGTGLTLIPTVAFGGTGGSNYAVTLANSANGVINPALLRVVVDSSSRLYGAGNPNLGATVTGVVGTDTVADLGLTVSTTAVPPQRFIGPASLGGIASDGSSVGAYPITAAITDTNYMLRLTPGTLTINPAPLTVDVNNASRLYGGANPLLTGTTVGLLGPDTATSVGLSFATTAIGGTSAAAGSNVGAYPISAALGSANYTLSVVPGTLTVNPAPLTVTVDNAERAVGQPNPPFNGLVIGLVGADSATGIGLNLVTTAIGGSNGSGGSPPGLYPIFATIADANYVETLLPGTLSIFSSPTTPSIGTLPNPFLNALLAQQPLNIPERTAEYIDINARIDVRGSGVYEYLTGYFAGSSHGMFVLVSPP